VVPSCAFKELICVRLHRAKSSRYCQHAFLFSSSFLAISTLCERYAQLSDWHFHGVQLLPSARISTASTGTQISASLCCLYSSVHTLHVCIQKGSSSGSCREVPGAHRLGYCAEHVDASHKPQGRQADRYSALSSRRWYWGQRQGINEGLCLLKFQRYYDILFLRGARIVASALARLLNGHVLRILAPQATSEQMVGRNCRNYV
jgi:hypothetical protein